MILEHITNDIANTYAQPWELHVIPLIKDCPLGCKPTPSIIRPTFTCINQSLERIVLALVGVRLLNRLYLL